MSAQRSVHVATKHTEQVFNGIFRPPEFPKSPQSKCTREGPGYPSLGKEQRGQNFQSVPQHQVWEHPQLQHPGVLKGDVPGRQCKQPNTLMFKWLQGQRTANKSKPNVFLSSPCFLPHVTIHRQLHGVEIRTPPLENPQKDRAGVSDSFPLCHVQITKCFCSKLLCKPTLQRSMGFGLIKQSYVRGRLTGGPYMGTEHLGKHTDLCLPSPRCPSRATCDHHHPNEPAPPQHLPTNEQPG